MIQDLDRFRFALRFACVDKQELRAEAWLLARNAMAHGFYLHFATFPDWTTPEGTFDFEPLWSRVDLADPHAVCVSLLPSPIDDEIGDSILEFVDEGFVTEVLTHPDRDIGRVDLESHSTVRGHQLMQLLNDVSKMSTVADGFAAYGDITDSTNIEVAVRGELGFVLLKHLCRKGSEPMLFSFPAPAEAIPR